ncbi:hypothetical protein ALO79_200267 [Pseudomonas syringae pv. castaneae]|uniref:Uncharacterized protein n=1 Tax=Pseudomonas syringae pv. castaneae TaxID=264450 RepID=A0A0P9N780_PSESX|nr:hypothetical protein ALO79_200267 [Pseudomonas syringae pv. castaneae]
MHQVGEYRADLVHPLAQLVHIRTCNGDVQVTDLRVGVGRQGAVLALGTGVGFLAGVAEQVQGVDLDLLAQSRLTHFGFVHLRGGKGIVLAQGTGVGNEQDQAPAITGPVHALHRFHDPGKRILVERMAGHR